MAQTDRGGILSGYDSFALDSKFGTMNTRNQSYLASGMSTGRESFNNILSQSRTRGNEPNFDVFSGHSSFRLAPERPEQFRSKVRGVVPKNQVHRDSKDQLRMDRGNSTGRSLRQQSFANADMSLMSERSSHMFSMAEKSFNVSQIQNMTSRGRGAHTSRSRSMRRGDPSPHRTFNYYKNLVSSNFLKPRPLRQLKRDQQNIQSPQGSGRVLRKTVFLSQQKRHRRSGKKEPMNTPVEKSKENTPGIMTPGINSPEELNMISSEDKLRRKWR